MENTETKQLVNEVKIYAQQEELSKEMVQAFIENVMVFDNEHIQIQWNFKDENI